MKSLNRATTRPLTLLLIAYIALASLYSVATPIWEASDEQWHYPMIKYLADNRLALPVQVPGVETAWRQEGGQPPLYYMLGALLTFWIDTSDMARVRYINPHADIGVVVPDGNANMAIHDPSIESFPWHGTVLALHLVRLLSVAFGAITVAMTYTLTIELFAEQHWLALGAAAFTAFNPMFLFISGSVNNDNLSNALASVLLVLIVRLVKRKTSPSMRQLALIGLIAGAGMLAKFNIGFLLPLIGLSLALNAFRLRDWRPLVIGGLITGTLTVLLSGWWYIRNWQLYGDPTGLNIFLQIVGRRPIAANWAQLWSERHTFLMSYWGFFGGVNVPLPDAVYTIFNAIAALSALGLLLGLATFIWHLSHKSKGTKFNWPILLGRAFTAIWIVVLFVSLLRWTSETWASQGRLMFAAIAPLSMWMVVGLWQLGRLLPVLRWRLVGYAAWCFAVVASAAPAPISRTYNYPYLSDHQKEQPLNNVIGNFYEPGQKMPSVAVFPPSGVGPLVGTVGDNIRFMQCFALGPQLLTHDWSIFVHLEDQDGLIVAQRDVYPGQGQWATSLIKITGKWCNYFVVHIPDYAYAPQYVQAYLGFYDHRTGERMIYDKPVSKSDDRFFVNEVTIFPRKPDPNPDFYTPPNPMNVNFGDETELVGYDVSSLIMRPGQQAVIILYWRAKHPIKTDYRVFTQIVEPNTTHVFARDDAMPAEWTRPTTTWQPGEIIQDRHTFKVDPNAPLGTWQIIVGMYQLTPDNQFRRLRVITPDGGEANDYVELSRVKFKSAMLEF